MKAPRDMTKAQFNAAEALQTILETLKDIDQEARYRVLRAACIFYDIVDAK